MKRVLFILVALAILGGVGVFANPITTATDSLTVYGFIPTPEKTARIEAEQTLQSTLGIDFKGDEAVHYKDTLVASSGVKIGEWTVYTNNHEGTEGYKIVYSYGPLQSSTSSQTLDYVVLEQSLSSSAPVERENNGEAEITAGLGNTSVQRVIKVMLTSASTTAVETMSPASDFVSEITLNLIQN